MISCLFLKKKNTKNGDSPYKETVQWQKLGFESLTPQFRSPTNQTLHHASTVKLNYLPPSPAKKYPHTSLSTQDFY